MRETNAAMRMASNMFWLSDEAEPSVPMPTLTLWSSMARAGATPDPSRKLLPGLCATDAPLSARSAMSSSSSQTLWAPVNRGPIRSRSSRCIANVLPYLLMPVSAWIFDSARCICTPTS